MKILDKIFKRNYVNKIEVSRSKRGIFLVEVTTNSGKEYTGIIPMKYRKLFVSQVFNTGRTSILPYNVKFNKDAISILFNILGDFEHFTDSVKPFQLIHEECRYTVTLFENVLKFYTIEDDKLSSEISEFELETDLDSFVECLGTVLKESRDISNYPYIIKYCDFEGTRHTEFTKETGETIQGEEESERSEIWVSINSKDNISIYSISDYQAIPKEIIIDNLDTVAISKMIQGIRQYQDEINEEMKRGVVTKWV